ncbi:MAG: hypothetical protein GF398_04475 [Chitinivibrionales bacterium]|nr:hypothetical protein [Chitinivibrionales bacterium]
MTRSTQPVQLGNTKLAFPDTAITGQVLEIDGRPFYKIANYDELSPFFITVVSHTNLWMYASSTGSLTCGRVSPDFSLFPYETVDKIHLAAGKTGPRTVLHIEKNDKCYLWEPFTDEAKLCYQVERNIYKSAIGNRLMYEEVNATLQCTYRSNWSMSDEYGFVLTPELLNNDGAAINYRILAGLLNVMPYGIPLIVSEGKSSLSDAYKKTELDAQTGIGIFYLSSNIVDRAEPSEAMRASIVWHQGLEVQATLLSPDQIDAFKRGRNVTTETELKGRKGAYLVSSSGSLRAHDTLCFNLVADVAVGQAEVVARQKQITSSVPLAQEIGASIDTGTEELIKLVGTADGLQCSSEKMATSHHFANVLFNIARGGIFADRYELKKADLIDFVSVRNKKLLTLHQLFFDELADNIQQPDLLAKVESAKDPSLIRLVNEYLPISFSRRHGDPSRPWNKFSIHLKNADGSKCLNFEGNWRDIFQNWEALSLSFPSFIPGFIATFADASTIDGYNPYRITRRGIDWEILNPDDPWSSIGYWGDHQIIYLLKFLEWAQRFYPELLNTMLTKEQFSYANVPYDVKRYADILANSQDTIAYNDARAEKIARQVEELGADGKMVLDKDGSVYHASLLEKMLVSTLSKLSNLVLEGGVWMNTLRPEWNDANNALVGNGISMVTLYSLRRYIAFLKDLLANAAIDHFNLTSEVGNWLNEVSATYQETASQIGDDSVSPQLRRAHLDSCGTAFEQYRFHVYEYGFSGKTPFSKNDVITLLDGALTCIDHSIRRNKRDDGLYHAYNLLHLGDGTAEVEHLYLMLEGQVGVLTSGALSAREVVEMLKAMERSPLYRKDQHSYMLYPDRQLASFLEKNRIPADLIDTCTWLKQQLASGSKAIVLTDPNGTYRFNPDFRNADDLKKALSALPAGTRPTEAETKLVLDIHENVFNHKAFTGRSGSMFCYEGLGCIYWHQVAKLLLAVQEQFQQARAHHADDTVLKELKDGYYRVRRGLSFNKKPDEYGTFPIDPYSHTPSFSGAKQPGMTGQVKEEIISRWGELGVCVVDGQLTFQPKMLLADELLTKAEEFRYVNNAGRFETLKLEKGELGFTYCGVPVIYSFGADTARITVTEANGARQAYDAAALPTEVSNKVFWRSTELALIRVELNGDYLLP